MKPTVVLTEDNFRLRLAPKFQTERFSSGIAIWIATPQAIMNSWHLESYLELLDDQEREQYTHFRFIEDQQSYVVAHALLRTTLSRYFPYAPQQWQFQRTPHGRPELVPGPYPAELGFSLSHTRNLTACIVSLTKHVGVDVESLDTVCDETPLVERVFSPGEQRHYQSLNTAGARRRYFLEQWCLKEAFAKAVGLGLVLDFRDLDFWRDEADAICFKGFDKLSAGWHFFMHWLRDNHCLAAAAYVPETAPLGFQIFEGLAEEALTCLRVGNQSLS
jgi:4'-phosphopantetheinyl transferase